MKIALLCNGITPFVIGGMQKHSYNLAKSMVQVGVNVTLIHCVSADQKIPSEEEVNNALFGSEKDALVKSICFHFPSPGIVPGHYVRNSFKFSAEIYETIKDNLDDFDFVYAKGFSAWKLLKEKKKGKNCPPIGVKFHGYEMYQPPSSFKGLLKQLLLRGPVKWNNENADVVFSYGGKITTLIKTHLKTKKIVDIPSGIDANWINESEIQSDDLRKFVFVGRFEERKGIIELTESIKLIPENVSFHFNFVGPIPAEFQLNDSRVTYHGELKDEGAIRNILYGADVLVCPSFSEGMPNVILEGMASSCAVFATRVGAIEELVTDNCGVLIEKPSVEAIHEGLVHFINLSKEQLDEIKRNANHRVKNEFLWQKIAMRTKSSINAILKEESD